MEIDFLTLKNAAKQIPWIIDGDFFVGYVGNFKVSLYKKLEVPEERKLSIPVLEISPLANQILHKKRYLTKDVQNLLTPPNGYLFQLHQVIKATFSTEDQIVERFNRRLKEFVWNDNN